MTTDRPRDPASTSARKAGAGNRPRRGHAALGARILVAGTGTAMTIGLAALMVDASSPGTTPEPASAVVATSPDTGTSPATVIRVVVRRTGAGSVGSPTAVVPAPAPRPAAAASAPDTRSQSS